MKHNCLLLRKQLDSGGMYPLVAIPIVRPTQTKVNIQHSQDTHTEAKNK